MQVAEVVLFAASPKIALFVEICFQHAVMAGHQSEHPDVEFTLVNEQRILNILLQDHRLLLLVVHLHELLYFL